MLNRISFAIFARNFILFEITVATISVIYNHFVVFVCG